MVARECVAGTGIPARGVAMWRSLSRRSFPGSCADPLAGPPVEAKDIPHHCYAVSDQSKVYSSHGDFTSRKLIESRKACGVPLPSSCP